MKKTTVSGKIWILEENGILIEDIDTDQIYHNRHLPVTRRSEMGQFALGNLRGWEHFPQITKSGDIIIAGRNFGAGSSRQQAVDCFISLGITAIIAESFGAIYFRNAVNSGFPLFTCSDLNSLIKNNWLKTGDQIALDLLTCELIDKNNNMVFHFNPMSEVQSSIFLAGNLFLYGEQSLEKKA